MAPPRGLSTPRANKNKNDERKTKYFGHETYALDTDVDHILHTASYIHVLWLSHSPRRPTPLKRPQNSKVSKTKINCYLLPYFVGAIWAIRLHAPAQGPSMKQRPAQCVPPAALASASRCTDRRLRIVDTKN